MNNIFQGNSLIRKCIADSLGYNYDKTKDEFKCGWFTKDIYLSAFFYLVNRFGIPEKYEDDYKTAGMWSFFVKDFIIQITFLSTYLQISIFGKKWHFFGGLTEYDVRRNRLLRKNSHKLLHFVEISRDTEVSWNEKYVDTEEVEKGLRESDNAWEYLCRYNDKASGVDKLEINNKPYQNSYTKRALKTLTQFLNNMLTPIYVRDVAYNIKGRCGDEFAKYRDNIEIRLCNK